MVGDDATRGVGGVACVFAALLGEGVNFTVLGCLPSGDTGVFRPDDEDLVNNLLEDPDERFNGEREDATMTFPLESCTGALSLCEATRFKTVPVRPKGGGK